MQRSRGVAVTQSFQTNATLIDDAWCDFIRRRDVHVGVSVDGPAFLHDRHRRTRRGGGTLDRVLRGIRLLHEHDIAFNVITVLTADVARLSRRAVRLLPRATASRRSRSTSRRSRGRTPRRRCAAHGTEERFRRFLSRFLDLALAADPPLTVREFETARRCAWRIATVPACARRRTGPSPSSTSTARATSPPTRRSCWACPARATAASRWATWRADSLQAVLASPRFLALDEEIGRGVESAGKTCRYFAFCGGGPPGNKYFENGTFASTETLFCRLHKQVTFDVALTKLERLAAAS